VNFDSTDDEDLDVETGDIIEDGMGGYIRSDLPVISYARKPDKQDDLITNRLEDNAEYITAWNVVRMWVMGYASRHHLIADDPDRVSIEEYLEIKSEHHDEIMIDS
jgi:hypothetical protein